MDRVIREETPIAKKMYKCDACWWWRNYMTLNDCETPEQKQIIQNAKHDDWKILPGQQYRNVIGIQDGELVTFRARIDVDHLCWDLEVYPNE